MFENLSPREKKLATVVFSLLPVFLILVIGLWYSNAYFGKRAEITRLRGDLTDEKRKQLDGQLATQRRVYYRSISLPFDQNNDAKNQYKSWLESLVRDEMQMTFRNLEPLPTENVKYSGNRNLETVFVKHPYTLRLVCTLDQLTEFLHRFYGVNVLHRIASMSIIPRSAGSTGEKRKIRSGKLAVELRLEVISLLDADARESFTGVRQYDLRDLDEYKQTIVARDIFGPANNEPTLSIKTPHRTTEGSDVSFTFSGRDADDNDLLSYTLLETPIEGAKVVPVSANSRSAKFTCPPLEPGEYGPFKVQVSDNGFPSKTSEVAEFMITVDEKIPEKDPPPEFKHAGETKITGIVREKDGTWYALLRVMTKPKDEGKYKLKQGDQFHLDKIDWFVHQVTPKTLVLKTDKELLTYRSGDRLDKPTKSEPLTETVSR